jgi:hypothetical protein
MDARHGSSLACHFQLDRGMDEDEVQLHVGNTHSSSEEEQARLSLVECRMRFTEHGSPSRAAPRQFSQTLPNWRTRKDNQLHRLEILEPPSRHFRTTIRVRHVDEPIQDFHQCAPRERNSRLSAALPTASMHGAGFPYA